MCYSCFFRDLGGEDQSSLICGTWTLQLQNDLSPQCLGVHCSLQPRKTPVADTRGTWCKTPCLQLKSHLMFAVRLKARYAGDVIHYPEGFADTLPESDWQGLPRQMLAHISQQKQSRVVTIQKRERVTNKILKVRAWCACEI